VKSRGQRTEGRDQRLSSPLASQIFDNVITDY
jgi:hypothetical protein